MGFRLFSVLLLQLLAVGGFVLRHHASRIVAAPLCSTSSESTVLDVPVPVSITARIDKDYDAGAITVLEGLEPVRKRPGMYIGSTGQRGLHHLVFEVVDNSVDESLAGHCTEIMVTLHGNGSVEVQDNGRGIPCGLHPTTGKSSLETVLCVLHAGGKFGGDDSGYKVSGGLHGVGISVVNALSEHVVVDVFREGKKHSMEFRKGIPQTDLVIQPLPPALASVSRGTRVLFKPDPEIFKTTVDFDFDKLASRVDELAYLNAGLTLRMIDRRSLQQRKKGRGGGDEARLREESRQGESPVESSSPATKGVSLLSNVDETSDADGEADEADIQVVTYRHDGGIAELVSVLTADKQPLHPEINVIKIKDERKGVQVEAALCWSKDFYAEALTGFANGIRTSDGGSHLEGLKAAVAKSINAQARKTGKLKEKDLNIPAEFLREGLTGVVSVKVPEPEFEGQTKTRLGNPEVRGIVDSAVSEALTTMFEWQPQVLAVIVNKALEAQAAALAAKAAREMVRRKSLLHSTVLPGKLADCSSRNPAESEIYVVEGDSAAGSAKQGRDRRTQAILPLRGKILNIEKASNEKIYQNAELQALISALGLGIRGADFDVEALRYHRIVIMTDADVDGSHIRILLLTFLYRYQPELIQRGFIYIACPPLYKVTTRGRGGREKYLFDQADYDQYMASLAALPSSAAAPAPVIQRFKGLGEMMPAQLWSTTMDPSSRILKLVSIDDAAAADKMFSVLMGDNVQPRKEFITSNADRLKLEDLDY